jgi:putative transposase
MIAQAPLPKVDMCKIFEVSRAGFYKRKKTVPPIIDNIALLLAMQDICTEFSKYGYRRVTKELHRRGNHVNHKKVRRLMKENNLLVKRKRNTPKTTDSNHKLPRHPNLLLEIEINRINQAWVTDITYVVCGKRFLYLALIMDLFSRKIVGWELSSNVDTDLTLGALNKAVQSRTDITGCIHHSDHGSQYLSDKYTTTLHQLGMLPSMGEVGNSYDNAFAESLNKTVKNEEVWINDYETFEQAYEAIAQFIKKYNEKRLHSSIGYMPPNEYEQQQLNTAKVL